MSSAGSGRSRCLTIDYPLYDQHITVTVHYAATTQARLPEPLQLTRLGQFEDALLHRTAGQAVLTATETLDGRRVFHLYADPAAATARQLSAAPPDWPEGPAEIGVTLDPGWEEISRFLC